ncbi:MAG: hypothetical protein ACR2GN_05095 [Bacteroidia bacterium]
MFKTFRINYFKMLVLFAGIFLSSCFEASPDEEMSKKFFDLKEYFLHQAEVLEKNQISVEKILINSLDTQRVSIEKINWKEELAPFINSDLNKPAWRDSYSIDSAFNNSNIKSIAYKSLDENLPIKEIQIHFKNKSVEHIFIEGASTNYIYNSAQVLSFSPATGYTIEGEQDIILGKDLHYKVMVNFYKK